MRYFPLLILVILLQSADAMGQLNSDYKEVRRKHIKSATVYEVSSEGDTVFTTFGYDKKGRMLVDKQYCWNEFIQEIRFDKDGYEISVLELLPRRNLDTVKPAEQRVRARSLIIYDTIYYSTGTRDERNPLLITSFMELRYDSGKRTRGTKMYISGDTTFECVLNEHGTFTIVGYSVQQHVDSIERGYATVAYYIWDSDTFYDYCEVVVLDRHGSVIRQYHVHNPLDVQYEYEDFPYPDMSHPVPYNPLNDSSVTFVLDRSTTYTYNRKGDPSSSTTVDPGTGKTETRKLPDGFRLNSLEVLRKEGSVVTFEYY